MRQNSIGSGSESGETLTAPTSASTAGSQSHTDADSKGTMSISPRDGSGRLSLINGHSVTSTMPKMIRERSHSTGNMRENVCRMVILGAPAVGKTALTVRFLTRRFIGEYCPTLETVHKHQSVIDDDEVNLELMDSAGDVEDCWKEDYGLWGDCFMFVYSIADRQSYEQIRNIKRQIENSRKSTSIVCILVGNKSDLNHERQVSQSEGTQLAEDIECQCYEVSAQDGTQVAALTEMFKDLYREYRKHLQNQNRRERKLSSSARFKQAISKVIFSGGNNRTSSSRGRTGSNGCS